jgi:hypothetical protein
MASSRWPLVLRSISPAALTRVAEGWGSVVMRSATLFKPFTSADLVACAQKALRSGHHERQDTTACP